MPILPLALPQGSSLGRQPHAGIARLINCYAETAGEGQRATQQIWAAPGLSALATLTGSGGVRGIMEVDGEALVVAGRTISRVDAAGSATVIGGLPSDGYVGMARNQRGSGAQSIICCDGLGFVVAGGALTRITDPDLGPPVDVCVVNRSAIFAIADGRMFRSEIDDALTVDGLDVAVAEGAPDGLSRVVDRGSELVALGQRSFEVWTDAGAEAFGFARQHVVRVGCVGARAVTKASVVTAGLVTDTVAWIATDHQGMLAGIVVLDGWTPRKISTLAEDVQLAAVADLAVIVATSWVADGQGFIAFRLPDTSLVYNTSTQRWHDRQSRTALGDPTTWRVAHTAVLGGRVIAGDATSPRLYTLAGTTHDEDGDELAMTVRTPPVQAHPGEIEMNEVFLDVVPGVGLAGGAAHDTAPEIAMRFSRDGETWSASRTRALGRQGQRGRRVSWTRLGTFDQATLEFACSAAVVRGLMGAQWEGRVIAP